MKTFSKIFFLFLLSLNLFASESSIDSITLTKIKKLVEKEEEIAIAYKKYLLEKGTNVPIPNVIDSTNNPITILKNGDYLPKGFDEKNPFGKDIKLILDNNSTTSDKKDDKHNIKGFETDDLTLKSNLYDYYYSDKYRIYTKAPLSINNSKVEIKLSSKEKFIYENSDQITTVQADAISATASEGKYYLDKNGILHMYQSGKYKFSVAKDLIVDKDFTIFESNGKTVTDEFKGMTSSVTFAGQTILHNNGTTADEYLGISDDSIIKTSIPATVSTESGLLQLGPQSGGMIVNGDIYTWGNNSNRITGIDLDSYTDEKGDGGDETAVITTLVKAKAKIYDDDSTDEKDLSNFYSQNYFSSPFRPRFADLFTSIFHGTCGITTEGALYCGGTTGNNYTFGNNYTQVDTTRNGEMLYRSTFFNGLDGSVKAKKVFALNQIWLILSEDGDIYRWGYENTEDEYNGFSGNGSAVFNSGQVCEEVCKKWHPNQVGRCLKLETQCFASMNTNKDPEKITISTAKFTDITYTFTEGYRKIAALSSAGEIYIWGMDSEIIDNESCTDEVEIKKVEDNKTTKSKVTINFCTPTKITKDNSTLIENITFQSVKGGVNAFIALGTDGKYYKINQPKKKGFQVTEILGGEEDEDTLPDGILSIDLTEDETVIYVNAENQLISDHFSKGYDNTFIETINSMSWKSIKVLEAENDSMCALNTDNQLYCWGIQSYYKLELGDIETSTFMLPVFNTNLFDSKTDYLVAEAEDDKLTEMTSGTWYNSKSFYIKYPTYIGGFNYEFIFK